MAELPDLAPDPAPALLVDAVEWLPSGDESGLVRVHGRLDGAGEEADLPALVVRDGEHEHRFESLPDARPGREAGAWQATYVVPAAFAAAGAQPMWVESGPGARAPLPASSGPLPALGAGAGGRVIDRGVLAERRARRAEAAAAESERAAAGLRERLAAAEAESSALRERLAHAEEDAGSLRERLTAGERDIAELRRRIAAHEASARTRLRLEAVARGALEDELDRERARRRRLAGDLAATTAQRDDARRQERAARDAAQAADRELAAARFAAASAEAGLASLRTELEAERAARRAAQEQLNAARADAERAGESLQARIGELERRAASASGPARLERLAREQAAVAAAVRPAAGPASGEVAARLEAAATALRERTPAAAVAAPVRAQPVAPAPRLRAVLVELAHDDPVAAGRLLAALLPAQGVLIDGPLSYDVTIREVGTFAVTVAEGGARAQRLARARGRRQAEFHLKADALTLAELLAGAEHRIGRFRGRVRISGRRRRHAPLLALPAAEITLAAAARAGARLDPGLAWQALSHAVPAAWTTGMAFTVVHRTTDGTPRAWYLTVRDAAGLTVSTKPPDAPPAVTVAMTRAAFDRLLRDEPHPPGDRPSIRGDHEAVAALLSLIDRVRG